MHNEMNSFKQLTTLNHKSSMLQNVIEGLSH